MAGRPSTGKRTQIRVEPEDLQRLETWAQQHQTTKTAAIRHAIARFLTTEENPVENRTRLVLDVSIHKDPDKEAEFHSIFNTGEENPVELIREFLIEQANKIADHLHKAEQEKEG